MIVNAQVVRTGDDFSVVERDGRPVISHKKGRTRGDVVSAYAVVIDKKGPRTIEVLSVAEALKRTKAKGSIEDRARQAALMAGIRAALQLP
jgi:hypothetical protein